MIKYTAEDTRDQKLVSYHNELRQKLVALMGEIDDKASEIVQEGNLNGEMTRDVSFWMHEMISRLDNQAQCFGPIQR